MKPSSFCALIALAAPPAAAQDDCVLLHNGTRIDGVRVSHYDVRSLRYTKGGSAASVATDQVASITLGRFADVYRRGLSADQMLKVAREQLDARNPLLAQLGFVGAAARFFAAGEPAKATGALDALQKAIPDAGVITESYRQKFAYFTSLAATGAQNAAQVARQYRSDALSGSWPEGFVVEAEFFLAMAERGSPKDFAARLRAVIAKSDANPRIANRASVELAHSLRTAKDVEAARRLYRDVADRDGVDADSRAGALLGLGMLLLEQGTAADPAAFKQALLLFLRVRLETRDAGPGLHAEALYRAIVAADKWRGPDYSSIMARCRRLLSDEFPGTEWAKLAKDHH
ncbi:MAG TPA: hypothetical protein VF384_16790 [Planctomycetota bacterium]